MKVNGMIQEKSEKSKNMIDELAQSIIRYVAGMGIGEVASTLQWIDDELGTDYYYQLGKAARRNAGR